jgi:hypothetical protein
MREKFVIMEKGAFKTTKRPPVKKKRRKKKEKEKEKENREK